MYGAFKVFEMGVFWIRQQVDVLAPCDGGSVNNQTISGNSYEAPVRMAA